MKKHLQDPTKLVFRPATSVQKSREVVPASMLTIVNTKRFGKRVMIAAEVREKLGDPASIQVAFDDDGVFLGEDLGLDSGGRFSLKANGKNAVIYSSELVKEITGMFGLDFSNKTSVSFQNVTYLEIADSPAAYITLLQQGPASEGTFEQDDRNPSSVSNQDNDLDTDDDAESDNDLEPDDDEESDEDPELDSDGEFDDDLDTDDDGESDDDLDLDADDEVDVETEGDISEEYRPLALSRHKRGRIS
ncbi:hypothetical protein [Paenibacillus pasadenensis]|uniref:hypothetical protein n=1 Tax=Paenibacillus pasadenensis TaxID=217090 RepID=UPI000C7D8AB0|nr:hypothetical protein [Paenibacillus pasadenensis]